MTTFLVPVDGSDCSNLALAKAIELSRFYGAVIHVIHVYDVDKAKSFFNDEKTIDMQAYMTEKADSIVAEARKFCEDKGISCVAAALEGNPSDRIVEYAKDNNIDMIIMGSRGLTGLRSILGSVTHKVLSATQRPVLVVQ